MGKDANPSTPPSKNPTAGPTKNPTAGPTKNPTAGPTNNPTAGPTNNPTAGPTIFCPEKIILHDENITSIFNFSDKEAIKCYDTSLLTDMNELFEHKAEFNGDVSDWDVSSVTKMNTMFADATEFNGAVSDWDVSSVTDMDYMFYYATNFDNSQICKWNVDDKKTLEWLTGSLCSSTSCCDE